MAANDILVKIGADITDFSRKMADSNKALSNFSKANKDTFDAFKQTGAIVTGAGIALAGGLGLAVNEAVKFESSFAGVRKTVEATEAEFAELSQGFRDLAKEIPLSVNEINAIGESAGQLGIEKKHILDFTRTMADLGVATNMSSEEAATALARLANITGMPQTEFDKLGSTIVDLGNNLATTESEIVEMGLRLAGAGKQVGMSEAEIMSFSGALSSVGIEAEAGGSAFSKVMVNMQLAAEKGGEDLENFAKVAGMSADEFKQAFEKDASGAMIEFIKGLSTAEERGMSAIGVLDEMGISEVRMRDALLRAAGASDVFTEALDIGTNAWDENTALTDEAAERYKTIASQMEILKNTVIDVALSFGEALMPAVQKVVEWAQKLATWFSELSDTTKTTIAVITAVTAALALVVGPMLLLVGFIPSIIAGFASIKVVLVAVKTAFVTAGLAISSTVLIIVGVIAALVAAFVWAYNNIEWFREDVIVAWEWIKQAILTTVELIKEVIQMALEFIKSLWDEHGEIIIGIATTIWAAIQEAITAAITFIQDTVGLVLDKISDFWSSHGEFITSVAKSSWENLKSTVTTAINAVRGTIELVMGIIKGIFQVVWPIISGIVQVTWAQIKTTVSNAIELVSGIINTVMSVIQGDWEGAWNTIKDTASNIMDNIVNTFEGIDLKKIGKDIIDGLINGIKSKVKAVGDAVKSVTDSITGKIKGILGIKSPSRVLAQIGRWTGEGLANGITNTTGMVAKASELLADAATPEMSAIDLSYATPSGISSSLASAVSGTVDVNSREDVIAGAIENLGNKLENMRIEMDRREFGRVVSDEVTSQRDDSVRGGGRRRI